ncbi:keratin, type II cytoskeletal 75-like [Ornithorhynchus anatinus]|uniref:keratin, type II cytoskeletal 75-like n=1 Tax=Ornithorhynchus anatinus TaxID=9258 RepID=UPI0019D4453A|nr:keratin, type II cytoskeletal 75-like [Ornithorhynchus anatinus]
MLPLYVCTPPPQHPQTYIYTNTQLQAGTQVRRRGGARDLLLAKPEFAACSFSRRSVLCTVPGTWYEAELLKRGTAENDFVALKKKADLAYVNKAELEAQATTLKDEINFVQELYKEELAQVQKRIGDTAVILSMDNSRCLDPDGIIADVKAQYEAIVRQSREEAESWYKMRYNYLKKDLTLQGDSIQETEAQISELTCVIQRLQQEIEVVKKLVCGGMLIYILGSGSGMPGEGCTNLQVATAEVEQCGELALKDARAKLTDLEAALGAAKRDLAQLLRDYQEMMNVKMGLDIEVATYQTLLEGEECRWVLGAEGGGPRNWRDGIS